MMSKFDDRSLRNLRTVHPLLQQLLNAAIKDFRFIIADAVRGEIAQTKAYATGHSKKKFGGSPHNWFPSLAVDIYPAPFKVSTPMAVFVKMQMEIIRPLANDLQIPIRQGIDFNRNGNLSDDRWDDAPHIELFPWRTFAKKSILYKG